jgi:hypothetical protein
MVKNDGSNESFPSEMNIMFNQTNIFQSCNQIQDWIGQDGCYLICNPSKLSIANYFNNMKSMKHIHLVYLVHCGLNFNHLVIDEVSNSGKADHPAIHHKEDMSIDKEDIDANVDLLLELN